MVPGRTAHVNAAPGGASLRPVRTGPAAGETALGVRLFWD